METQPTIKKEDFKEKVDFLKNQAKQQIDSIGERKDLSSEEIKNEIQKINSDLVKHLGKLLNESTGKDLSSEFLESVGKIEIEQLKPKETPSTEEQTSIKDLEEKLTEVNENINEIIEDTSKTIEEKKVEIKKQESEMLNTISKSLTNLQENNTLDNLDNKEEDKTKEKENKEAIEKLIQRKEEIENRIKEIDSRLEEIKSETDKIDNYLSLFSLEDKEEEIPITLEETNGVIPKEVGEVDEEVVSEESKDKKEQTPDFQGDISKEIEFIMGVMAEGIGDGAKENSKSKIQQYVDRILSGEETRESVVKGLPQSFVDGIDALLEVESKKQNSSEEISENEKIVSVEDKKADIERRRQEAHDFLDSKREKEEDKLNLDSRLDLVNIFKLFSLTEGGIFDKLKQAGLDWRQKIYEVNFDEVIKNLGSDESVIKKVLDVKQYIDKIILENKIGFNNISEKYDEKRNEINAKYDAELSALNKLENQTREIEEETQNSQNEEISESKTTEQVEKQENSLERKDLEIIGYGDSVSGDSIHKVTESPNEDTVYVIKKDKSGNLFLDVWEEAHKRIITNSDFAEGSSKIKLSSNPTLLRVTLGELTKDDNGKYVVTKKPIVKFVDENYKD
jgi:hypothetical protein